MLTTAMIDSTRTPYINYTERKEKLITKQKWDLAFVDEQYRTLLEVCITAKDRTNAKGCLDSMSRRLSGFTDNLNTSKEAVNELSEAEQAILEGAASQAKDELAKPRLRTA